MSDASSAMEIETTDTHNKMNKPLINGSSKHDSDDSLHEKFKLTISKLNSKISQLDNILLKLNEKHTPPNNKYNTRKRKTNSFVPDYDPSDDFVIPSTKRKSVTSSSPILPSSSGGRRSRRTSSSSVNDVRSPRRVQRTSRRRASQPLHPNVIEALEYGRKVVQDLRKHKFSYPFLKPVDPVALKIPDYFDVIKEPMDLGTVKERLESSYYASVQDFIEDTRLIWNNAMTYNHPDSDVFKMAKSLSDFFEDNVKKAIEIAEKTTEETMKEYKEKIESYQEMIGDYEQKINEIKDQMPKDVVPMIEVKKIKSTAKTNRPMHYEEKVRLSKMINELDEKYYSGIISIVEQEMPEVLKTDSEELELDIDELEPYVLWRIDDFLHTYVSTIPKETEKVEVKQEPQTVNETKSDHVLANDMHDDSSSSDSDSESSDSDSDSDDDSSMDASRNVLVSNTPEASVSNGTATNLDKSSLEVPSIVQAEVDVKNVEIQNADSWSKFNVSEENNDTVSKNDAFSKDHKESDPLWQEFLNRGKQNLQRAEQEEKLRKEKEQKEKEERERIQREEEEKKEKEKQLEEEAKKKREEEIKRRREEERRKREQEMNQASSGGLMETLY